MRGRGVDLGSIGSKTGSRPFGAQSYKDGGGAQERRKSKSAFLRDGGSGKILERNREGGRSRKLRGLAGA